MGLLKNTRRGKLFQESTEGKEIPLKNEKNESGHREFFTYLTLLQVSSSTPGSGMSLLEISGINALTKPGAALKPNSNHQRLTQIYGIKKMSWDPKEVCNSHPSNPDAALFHVTDTTWVSFLSFLALLK